VETFAPFRAGVVAVLEDVLPDVPLWDVIPDDVAELPCLVVGLPGGRPGAQGPVVFDLDLTVFVVGRRTSAGGSEVELVGLLDEVFTAFGGTRGTRTPAGDVVAVARVDPRVLSVAGLDCPAFTVELEASTTTC